MTSVARTVIFRRLQIVAMLGIFNICVVLTFCVKPTDIATNDQWMLIQPQVLETSLGLVGRLDAGAKVTLSAPFEGYIQDVAVSEGQRVERGQHLLTLDTKLLDIDLRNALAELLKAQRIIRELQNWSDSDEVARARRAVTNAKHGLNDASGKLSETLLLYEKGIVARMEVDALEQQVRSQRLDLAASEAELRAAILKGEGENLQIADMELKNAQSRYETLQSLYSQRDIIAPFAGIVLRPRNPDGSTDALMPQNGLRATQGQSLLELANLEQIKAIARIEEVDLNRLTEGMSVSVTGDGFNGLQLKGSIESISVQGSRSEVFGGSTTYETIVSLEPLALAYQKKLRLGMSAHLLVVTYRAENGMVVPESALERSADGEIYVTYRKEMQGVPSKIPVSIGRAVANGVEVFGLDVGYVRISEGESLTR